jgi:hypothetical protein
MNIIFGRDQALALSQKYTVLELDTFRVHPLNTKITAFCVIESMPIMDMPKVESMKNLHENFLAEYKKRDWNYCMQALEHLSGFWGHEVDTFYNSIRARIQEYSESELGDDWDGVINR